ncbi:MAG TPA: hypothetical protein VKY92_06050 [Verrucomicrobiae bacterium]|nr:hypothetical protein [Verrucomicrobiae bacterium]
MNALSSLLDRPEYVHTAINHFPLIGLLVAILTLVIGLVSRSRAVAMTGMGLVCVLSLSIWPVYAFGEQGFDRVLSMSDEKGEAFLKYHAELAHRWVFLYYVSAGVAALGLGLGWKKPRTLVPLGIASVLAAGASLAAGILIAQAGGEIRHREFRIGPPPAIKDEHARYRTYPQGPEPALKRSLQAAEINPSRAEKKTQTLPGATRISAA